MQHLRLMISRISVTTSPPKIFRLLYFEKSLHFNSYYRIIYCDNSFREGVTALEEGPRIYRCAVIGQAPMRFPWGLTRRWPPIWADKVSPQGGIRAIRRRTGDVRRLMAILDEVFAN